MPPEVTDEVQDMDAESSTVSEKDVAVDAASTAADAAPATPSSATDAPEADTLSVVRDVVDARKPAEAASSAEGEEGTDQGVDDKASEPDDESFSDVPFNKHPRFQQLLHERNTFKGPAAEYQKIVSFMDANGLTAEEAANGLNIMGLAKLNPQEAWKQLKPFVQNVLIAAGEVLPDDLAKRVDAKELTRDAALELSRLRAAQLAGDARRNFETQRGQRQQRSEASNALVSAASEWETSRRLRDPNFEAKLPRIQEKVAFLHAKGERPRDAAGVKDQLKKVYDAVNKEFAPATPVPQGQPQVRRPAISPVRGGQVAGTARSTPKSTLDIVRAGRQRA